MLCRFWRRWQMTHRIKLPDHARHPATDSVLTCMRKDPDCVVLFGLQASDTLMCAKEVHNAIIRTGGLSMLFECDVGNTTDLHERPKYRDRVFNRLFSLSWHAFADTIPENTTAWLLFDAADHMLETERELVEQILRVSKQSSKFKPMFVFHTPANTIECLQLTTPALRVQLAQPVHACRWNEAQLRAYLPPDTPPDRVQNAITAAAPMVSNAAHAAQLALTWTVATERLQRYVHNFHSTDGALTVRNIHELTLRMP